MMSRRSRSILVSFIPLFQLLVLFAAEGVAEPVRVATLLPFVEDALVDATDEAIVVASVRRSLHSPLAEHVIDLGNPHSPNIETLVEARPDLVIGDRAIHARFEAAMSRGGARVLLLDASGVDSTLAALEDVSEAIGGSSALDEKIATVRAAIDSVVLASPASILALFGSPGSFFVMSDRVWLGDLAQRIGFEISVSGAESDRFPGLIPVSDEAMALARPDLVVLVAHGDPTKIRADLVRRTERGGAWAGLGKARLGIQVLDPRLFSANPGLGLALAARELSALAKPSLGTTER